MKTFNLPPKIKGIIFDIDSTLYDCKEYAFEQVDCQIREFAKLRGVSDRQARDMIAEYRKNFALKNGGQTTSLGNALLHFGVSIEQSVEWRKTLLFPENFLQKDSRLICALKILSEHFKLICVTNNPVLPARKTLLALGVSDFFENIVGLDSCFKSKPAEEPFLEALKILKLNAGECVSVGDRYDLDVAIPLKMGMGGVLVDGVKDVYRISKIAPQFCD